MKLFSGMLALGLTLSTTAGLRAADGFPLLVRKAVTEYESHASIEKAEAGAEMIPRNVVKTNFFTPLAGQYYVVEVGIYPSEGQTVRLKRGRFRLRAAGKSLKPEHPWAMSNFLVKTAPPEPGMRSEQHRDYTIGVRIRGRPPNTQGSRAQVYQESHDGGSISNGRYWDPKDRDLMYEELDRLGLPEGEANQAVAGYLYFPIKDKGFAGPFELIYRRGGKKVAVPLAGSY